MFWKYRFQNRAGAVTTAFNPNIVPGFSAVILDRPLTPLEKAEGKLRKHFVGHVVSITHQISPQNASTAVQMVAVRPYDESIDFGERAKNNDDDEAKSEGKSLERIALGFDAEKAYFDTRYSPENIGTEFYLKILGCDSVVDKFSSAIGSDEITVEALKRIPGSGESKTVAVSVKALSDLYDTALLEKADLASFTSAVTWRPKATITQILGSSVALGEPTSKNYPVMSMETDSAAAGFMASAVDSDSADAKASYVTTEQKSSTKLVEEAVGPLGVINTDTANPDEVTETRKVKVSVVSAASGGNATYGLDEELENRQKRVKAYLDAIKYRGIRG